MVEEVDLLLFSPEADESGIPVLFQFFDREFAVVGHDILRKNRYLLWNFIVR